MKYQSTKSFWNYPCSHRQWRHPGRCAFIHGYSRSFHFVFEAKQRDENGFVMDFGGLKKFRNQLDQWFDHTLLVNADDPLLPDFLILQEKGACRLTILADVSMEGTASFLWKEMNEFLETETQGRVCCVQVEVRENEMNSAIFQKEA